jgi:transposase-like protein
LHPFTSSSLDQRKQALVLFEAGYGAKATATQLGLSYDIVNRLYQRWRLHGSVVLVRKPTNAKYPFDVKKEVVERFIAGETKMELAAAFDLSSPALVQKWVRQWREGGDGALRPKPKGRPSAKNVAATLTEEERLRKQLKLLEAENAYLKKLRDLRNQPHA